MKFDTVIIGGGLAGLLCGIRLVKEGVRCAIISAGQSALHFSSGSFDLLNCLPDGTMVDNPVEALTELIRQNPEHPYSRIGVDLFPTLAAEAFSLMTEAGIDVAGDCRCNHFRLTPVGYLKPTWLTIGGYVRSEQADKFSWQRVALFNIAGFLDFHPQFLSDAIHRWGATCSQHTIDLSVLQTLRENPSEMRSTNIARIFDRKEVLDELATVIRAVMGDAEVILLPAVLGIDRHDGIQRLESMIGRPVRMVATLPPSVPGIQTQIALRRYFQQLGGCYMLGDTAVDYDSDGDLIKAVYTANHGCDPLFADNFVLATGSYFSRGLETTGAGDLSEPLFGIDTVHLPERKSWYNRDLFEAQPFEQFGLAADSEQRALKAGDSIRNLYVAGAGLAGFNAVKEGCGAGVSMLTALFAASRILQKSKP